MSRHGGSWWTGTKWQKNCDAITLINFLINNLIKKENEKICLRNLRIRI